jgi:hypothetical protein
MKIKLFIACASCFLITNVYAEPAVVAEETTPPLAETALTPNQLPPIMTVVKPPQNVSGNNAATNVQEK